MSGRRWVPLALWGMLLVGYGADRLGCMPVTWRVPSQIPGRPSVWKLDKPKRVDGDTLRLTDGRKIRLVGIDTPEWDEVGGAEAKEFLDQFLAPGGVTVAICPEKSFDKYQRLLGRLYVQNRDYQTAALRAGRARSLTIAPCGLAAAEANTRLFVEALAQHRGSWRDSPQIDACDAGNWERRVVEIRGRLRTVRRSSKRLELGLGSRNPDGHDRTCLRAVVLADNLGLWCPGRWCQTTRGGNQPVLIRGKITSTDGHPGLLLGHPLEISAVTE